MTTTSHSSLSLWSNCRPNLQHRINVLLNNQADYFRFRVDFHRQIQQLQYEFSSEFDEILEQRRMVINEIPHFWLNVLKNLDSFDYPIRSRDELCLQYLLDIRCILNPPSRTSTSFTLEFHFSSSNPFFLERILTKTYSIRTEFDEMNPYQSYDGPEIDQCHGCSITWTENHNLTNEKRQKRLRNKHTGQIQSIEIDEPIKSFFNFFSPPIIPSDGIQAMTDDDQLRLETDIEYALLLKQRVLPKVVLFYTGEALPTFDEEISS